MKELKGKTNDTKKKEVNYTKITRLTAEVMKRLFVVKINYQQ